MTAKLRVSHTGQLVLWVGNSTRQVPAIFGQSAVGAFHKPSPNRVAFVFDGPIAAWLEYELSSSPPGESMTNIQSSGIEPGQRRLNGPQTTGRELSQFVAAYTRA